jgi:MOSC domain-containing protein YiiM
MSDAQTHGPHHVDAATLRAGLAEVRRSPSDAGIVEMLVVRPAVDARSVVDRVQVDLQRGLVGDSWLERGNSRTPDGSADPQAQVTVMNSRAALLMAGQRDRMPLAGDQLYLDLDLSVDNLPTGTVLEFADAALEVTAAPHTGCSKFTARFGVDALRLTATPDGLQLRLRGINARVVRPGAISVGETVRVVRPD